MKKCRYKDCPTEANFGYRDGKKEYCSKHKLDGMVNLHSQKCQHLECPKIASFGYRDGKKEYCSKHNRDGMINLHNKRYQQESSSSESEYHNEINNQGEVTIFISLSHFEKRGIKRKRGSLSKSQDFSVGRIEKGKRHFHKRMRII